MELAGAIQDEFLTCNICLEDYRQPKQLPCLHSFCRYCLSRYIAQTVGESGVLSVRCPICRRTSVPSDPDPRKLHHWADQYPDNFFVVSLRETLEARRNEERTEEDTDSGSPFTRYFMGEVNACSRHLTHRLTHYCQAHNIGVCDACMTEDPHSACEGGSHLDIDQARSNATDLLKKYREEIEEVKQDLRGVKQSFSRRPRLLQMKKEEVEISVTEYFSALRSSCAKLLLAKEREVVENLSTVIDDECERAGEGQKKCEDVTTSMTNTVSLFETLTHSGPFNAMHVLARVEGQVTNISRLVAKMDQESKSDRVMFRPPSQTFEEHVSGFDLGQIVAEFGSGEMTVPDPSAALQGEAGIEDDLSSLSIDAAPTEGCNTGSRGQTGSLRGSLQNLENRLSDLHLSDSSAGMAERGGRRETSSDCHPSAPLLEDSDNLPYLHVTSDSSGQTSVSDFSSADSNRVGRDNRNSTSSSSNVAGDSNLPPYSQTRGSSPLPSAPPISELSPPSPADWYDKSRSSPALAEAFQQSMRKDVSCQPLMVFSGNLPKESRRGGICGAARMGPKNRAAFVDRYNHSVKIVDLHQAHVVGYLDLKDLEPWDITFVPDGASLVVTCPASRYLMFISTEVRQLEVSYYYRTPHAYCCVAHLKEDQFTGGVCAPFGTPVVHVFNVKGVVLLEILPREFRYPRTIFVDSTSSQIIVSDWTSNTVVLVTSEGQLVSRYREAPSPKGVAVSELTGLMHVLDGKWTRLHLLDNEGHCVASSKVEGCRDPRTVVVVPTSSSHFPDKELTVIVDGSNALHVMVVGDSLPFYMSGEEVGYSSVQSAV
ncbi:hypothetical protein ACOMHN_017543 [Nucella lapillus]